jgi:hypothetical protein
MRTNMFRSPLFIALTGLGLVGTATPFLPFTSSTSPMELFTSGWPQPNMLAVFSPSLQELSFFLATLVPVLSIRLSVFGKASRLERAIACGAGVAVAYSTVFVTLFMLFGAEERFLVSSTWLAVAFGIALGLKIGKIGVPSARLALAWMQLGYVANGLFFLAFSWPDWQIGAVLTLATVVVYLGSVICLLLRKEFRGAQ